MNPLAIVSNAAKTMASLELLDLINRQRTEFGEVEVRRNHFHDRVRDELEGENYQSFVVTNPNGTQSEAFHLSLDQCMLVAMRESKGVRRQVQAKLRDAQAPVIDLNNPEHLRGLLGSYAEKAIALQGQLAIAAPKADALDRIAGATGSITIREAAKDLQVKPLTFSNWLREHKWIYKQGRSNLAHQPRIDAGYMAHKVTLVEVEGDDGVTFEKPVTQARITPKGLAKLAVVFGEVAA